MTAADLEKSLSALEPSELRVNDDSAKHREHGVSGGHFSVRIVSARFAGLSLVARHRLIYATLGDAMKEAIHALAIDARTPDEV